MSKRTLRFTTVPALSIALLAVLICSWSPRAALAAISVSLQPDQAQIDIGESVVVDINVSNPDQTGVKSWTVDLAFDPAVLDPTAFQTGPYISGVVAAMNLSLDDDGTNPDTARVGVINFSGTFGSDTTGLLGSVTFLGVGSGESPVTILTGSGDQTALLDITSAEIPGVLYSGTSITVPEPCTLLVLAGGGMALLRRKRRRG